MTVFIGAYIYHGQMRELRLEAETIEEARAVAAPWGVAITKEGVWGPAGTIPSEPFAYDEKTARRLLGGVSTTTLWRWVHQGYLARLPGTKRVLITRESVENWIKKQKPRKEPAVV